MWRTRDVVRVTFSMTGMEVAASAQLVGVHKVVRIAISKREKLGSPAMVSTPMN